MSTGFYMVARERGENSKLVCGTPFISEDRGVIRVVRKSV